jgi:hypothetical protein
MFNNLSDEERAAQQPPVKPKRKKRIRPRLSCPGHQYGVWMRDVEIVKTPGLVVAIPKRGTCYRRFCRICNHEQKGQGNYYGNNVEVTG